MLDRLPLPQPNLDREENPLDREEKAIGREKLFGLPRSVLDRTSTTGRPVPQSVEPFFGSTPKLFQLKIFKTSLKNI